MKNASQKFNYQFLYELCIFQNTFFSKTVRKSKP